jgi:hypothetical protein
VAEADIPRLHEVLAAIGNASLEAMQDRLHCAAQHLYYSSTLGAVMGENGQYDAFETLLEVLRMRRDHPGVPPARYAEVDSQFADFVACRLSQPGAACLGIRQSTDSDASCICACAGVSLAVCLCACACMHTVCVCVRVHVCAHMPASVGVNAFACERASPARIMSILPKPPCCHTHSAFMRPMLV